MAFPTGWGRRVAITIDNTKIPSNQSNFPVLIDLNNIPSEMVDAGSNSALNGGGDIRFSSDESGSTQLALEVVQFVTNATEGSRRCQLWVKVPSLSSSADTVIYAWYKKSGETQPSVSDTYGRNNVWSLYDVVYHMDEDPSGTAPQLIDSKGVNPLTTAGSMTSGDLVTGIIGNAIDFDTTDDTSNAASNSAFDATTGFTGTFWIKPGETATHDVVLKPAASTWGPPYASYLLRIKGITNELEFALNLNGTYTNIVSSKVFSVGTFYKITCTYDQVNMKTYINGVFADSEGQTDAIVSSSEQIYIGNNTLANIPSAHVLEEVRISKTAKTADWITIEYNNENSPSTFASAGTPVTPSAPAGFAYSQAVIIT